MKIKISEIVIREDIYPRDKVNQEKVKEYEQYLGVLPPVTLNQDKVLVDGFHRYYANKNKEQTEIEYNSIITKDDDDLLLKAVELNSKHGYQMSQKEKKDRVVVLYKKVLEGKAKTFDTKRIQDAFSIPSSTFSDWTKKLNDEIEGLRLQKILDSYLQNKTQQEIGTEVGLSRSSVTDKISEITEKIKELSENPKSEIPTKYKFLADKIQKLSAFSPFLYNIWNTQSNENGTKHFGNFPEIFMENLLYYYTEPFDVIYDPFAGGGVTIDACKNWLRKYYCSDAQPIELRKNEIKQWKIQDGLPDDLPSPDFVFLDPPYWKQAEGKYSNDENDLANISLEDFYKNIELLIKNIRKKMKEGYVAFVISPTQYPNEDHVFEDHIIKIIDIFNKNKFTEVMRYILPYSTQQYNGTQVNVAKDEKFCLSINRDLVVFRIG